jgi:hypothetical protein
MTTKYIGPNHPESRQLFCLPFRYQGKERKSLFHAAIGGRMDTDNMTVEDAHALFVAYARDDQVMIVSLMVCIGSYTFQHYDTVYPVLRDHYKDAKAIYVEGLEFEGKEVEFIRDMITNL